MPANIRTEATAQPDRDLEYVSRQRLTKKQKADLGLSLQAGIQAALAGRQPLESNLSDWDNMVELLAEETDWPWVDCLSRDTDILTADGWKKIDSVCPGETVLTRRDADGCLEWAPIEESLRSYSESLIHFQSKSIDQMVTANHRLVVSSTVDGSTQRRTASELLEHRAEWKVPLTGTYSGYAPALLCGLPSGDVLELIGWYVAEGWSYKSGSYGISQSESANPNKCRELESLFERLNITWARNQGRNYTLHSRSMPMELRELLNTCGIGAKNKRLPQLVFGLDSTLLQRLLHGLISGDGHITNREAQGRVPHKEYFSISEELAGQVQALAILCGQRARIHRREAKDGGLIKGRRITGASEGYTVVFGEKQYAQLKRIEPKIIPYHDFAYCVTVRNHCIYIRRNGIASFTGNSANIRTPMIRTELESLVAYIAGQVLVPRLFLVSGLTVPAAESAHLTERYYNAELKRQRGDTTWFEELADWLHLGVKDGTGYIEALWKFKKTTLRVYLMQQQMQQDELTGENVPVIGPDGLPVVEKHIQEVEDVHNDVDVQAVELRNVITIPAEATSVQDAMAVIRVEYLYEDRLMEMVHDGLLDDDAVEECLAMVSSGSTELAASQQPTTTYRAGDQINIGTGQGTQTSEFFRNRGPLETYRVHSRQYDLDNDGTPEENIFWVHSKTWKLLGWTRYEYFNGLRPFFPFSPFPRPKRLIGHSLVGTLSGLQNEKDRQRNQRLNENDLRVASSFIGKKGSSLEDQNMAWGPNRTWWTENPKEDFMRIDMAPIPNSAYAEESMITQEAKEYTGLANPMIGAQSSGRRSAAEARMWQAAAMTRTGLLAMRYRMAIRPLINFIHQLKKQYLTENQTFTDAQGNFTLPLPVLNQDYQIDIAGASDPIDAQTRRSDMSVLFETLMQNPDVGGNPLRRFYLTRKYVESFDLGPEIDKIVGTEQEAIQSAQGPQPPQPGAPQSNGAPSTNGAALAQGTMDQ